MVRSLRRDGQRPFFPLFPTDRCLWLQFFQTGSENSTGRAFDWTRLTRPASHRERSSPASVTLLHPLSFIFGSSPLSEVLLRRPEAFVNRELYPGMGITQAGFWLAVPAPSSFLLVIVLEAHTRPRVARGTFSELCRRARSGWRSPLPGTCFQLFTPVLMVVFPAVYEITALFSPLYLESCLRRLPPTSLAIRYR